MNPSTPPVIRMAGRLRVETHPDRRALGEAAARATAGWLQGHLDRHGEARVIFACAPSQDEFLDALVRPEVCGVRLTWDRVTLFHMDDYVGLTASHPQSFRHYLRRHLLSRITPRRFHPMPAEDPDSGRACAAYAALIQAAPIDLICLGIGENGHLAFNDPPVADFNDPLLVKRVAMDEICRQQQVNDGCFPTLDQVPRHALTLTLPVFREARRLSVHVPGPRKAAAVRATVTDPVGSTCPATLLRQHPAATLYLDAASASLLPPVTTA